MTRLNRITGSLLLLLCSLFTKAEIRSFSGELDAAPSYIHFAEGWLVAPGFIDLGGLLFETTEQDFNFTGKNAGDFHRDDDRAGDDDEDDFDDQADDEADDQANAEDNDENRMLATDDDGDYVESVIDIVFFHEPAKCSRSAEGCDWTDLGVGATDEDGNLRWCCWEDAIDLGLCKGNHADLGRLIINGTAFEGEHRSVVVSPTGAHEMRVSNALIEESETTGNFVMVMANCNEYGRTVSVSGTYVWKSKGGFLPGDLFGEMYFYEMLVILYVLLLSWYGIMMYKNQDNVIPIQKWIVITMFIGLMETFFKAGDLWVWNEDGVRFWFAMYFGVILGVAKRAIARCLVLMVSLGWGVVRDTLDDQMKKITILGALYVGVSIARDIFAIIAVVDVQKISFDEEEELFDIVTILTFVVAAIDVTFYMWILDALNGTMQYLENMNQNIKLLRYLRLRLILLLSILFAIAWAVFGIVDNMIDTGLLTKDAQWAIQALWEFNYLFVLLCVAVLWRPNDSAKQYAFVMELPSVGGDVEFSTNEGVEEDDEGQFNGHGGPDTMDSDDDEPLKVDDAVPS